MMAIDSLAAGTGRHHVVHDQYPACQRCTHQRAALAVVFGFLAVVGERHVAPQTREFDRHRRSQRYALVGRTKNHVEFDAAGQQAARIKFSQAAQLGAIVKQTGIEKVGRQPPGLGLEFTEPQHPRAERELHKIQ